MTSSSFISKGDFVYRNKDTPVYIRSEGPYLYDNHGRKYFDAQAANGCALLGYDSLILEEAVSKVRAMPLLPSFAESALRLNFAEKLCHFIHQSTVHEGHVAFEIGGAQAIELAMKIARKHTGRTQMVVFQGGYHGRSGYASQLSAGHRYRSILGDWRIPVVRLPLPDYERSNFPASQDEWREWYLLEVDHLLKQEARGLVSGNGEKDIAALLIEPVLNVGGMIKPDKRLLEGIVDRFKDAGALIVIDEIFTGFYRTGKPFGFQHYNIDPDMIVASKGLTNGLVPMSFVWGKEPLMDEDHFPPGTHSATFINNVMALATADTVLDRYAIWTSIETDVLRLEKALKNSIERIVKRSNIVKNGYALGGLGRLTLKKPVASDIVRYCMQPILPHTSSKPSHSVGGIHCDGILLANTGMSPDVINIHPPIAMSDDQVQEMQILLETFLLNYE